MQRSPRSFRDPSGFVFYRKGEVYRRVNDAYKGHYEHLMHSGLYSHLVNSGLLIPHKEVSGFSSNARAVLKPERIPFISYPFEWSFGQLKDAALTTLAVQKEALRYGMVLKDCSAYNIQFRNGKPVFIDTLSFEVLGETYNWVPQYQQFCRHFLAPLALMSYIDVRLNRLLQLHNDGVPLGFARSLLPLSTYAVPAILFHIHLNDFIAKRPVEGRSESSRNALADIAVRLRRAISGFKPKRFPSQWSPYYTDSSYTGAALQHKKRVVARFLRLVHAESVLDVGANTGLFSRLASSKRIRTVAIDNDPTVINAIYEDNKCLQDGCLLPLVVDIANPSPASGWNNEERQPFVGRNSFDAVLVLALVHHLAITHSIPFDRIARVLSILGKFAIVEFVPENDPMARVMLSRKKMVYPYSRATFEQAFGKFYVIRRMEMIPDSARSIYLMERKRNRK